MANAGTVTVDFAAETAKFTAELKKVREDLKSLKDDTSSIASGFSVASKAFAGLFTAGKVLEGIRAIAEETAKTEAAIAQLNSSLKNAGANVHPASRDFQDFAGQMQTLTTFSRGAVIGVESLLIGFRGLSSGTIKRATEDVLDLSAKLGIDLNTASKTVGKALEDPIKGMTALQRAGVLFNDTQKEAIKLMVEAGDKAGAQALVLSNLEGRFKGSAEAARNTLGGALTALHNSFNDLLEVSGTGAESATRAVNGLSSALGSSELKSALTTVFDLMGHILNTTIDIGKSAFSAFASLTQAAESAADKIDEKFAQKFGKAWENAKKGAATGLSAAIESLPIVGPLLTDNRVADSQALPRSPSINKGHGDVVQSSAFATSGGVDAESEEELKKRQALNQSLLVMIGTLNEEEYKLAKEKTQYIVRSDFEAFVKSGEERLAAINEQHDNEDKLEREALARRQQLQIDFYSLLAASRERFGLQEIIWEDIKAKSILGIASQLFTNLASHNKTFAKLQKDVALAQAIWYTAAGVANALRSLPFPANLLAAAKVAIVGAIQIAEIESTNVGGGRGSSGSSISGDVGTPQNPVFSDQSGNQRTIGATSQSAVAITINGFIGPAILDEMMSEIRDAVGNRDVVIINGDSRQAQELRGG